MVKISLCLLTKNNENSLRRCFYPIKEFLSEILAIDLASTDNTKKILEEYNAKIIDFNFQNDFSAAKNKLIEQASGNFILFLNPDEVIFKEDMRKLVNHLNQNTGDDSAYLLNIQNYTNNENARGFRPSRVYGFAGYFTSEQTRLIRNDKKIYFSFAKNESLMPCLDKMKAVIKHIIDIPIHNYKYQQEIVLEDSNDPRSMYNAAIAHLNKEEFLEAKEYFKKIVEQQPNYKKALFNLGSIYLAENKYTIASKMFTKSLEFDDKNAGAYYNLGLIFQQSKQFDKAELALKKAMSLESQDFRIYRNLALLYKEMGKLELAKRAVNSALVLNKEDETLLDLKKSLS